MQVKKNSPNQASARLLEELVKSSGAAGLVQDYYSPGPYRSQRELSLILLVGLVTRRPPTL